MPRHCGYSRNRGVQVVDESLSALSEQGIWRYIVRGTLTWILDDRRHVAGPGTVIATRQPSRSRMLLPAEPVDMIWITVQGAAAVEYFDRITHRFGAIHALPPSSTPVRRAVALVRLARRNRPLSPFVWSEQTYLWLSAWHRHLEEHRPRLQPLLHVQPADSRLLLTAVRSVKGFAAQTGYSPSHLTRLIGRTWRETPGKVFRRVRLEQAARLLRDTADPVGAIAGQVGYSSVPAFITAFKGKFGETPANYRRKRR